MNEKIVKKLKKYFYSKEVARIHAYMKLPNEENKSRLQYMTPLRMSKLFEGAYFDPKVLRKYFTMIRAQRKGTAFLVEVLDEPNLDNVIS
jgi:hypothetical protein